MQRSRKADHRRKPEVRPPLGERGPDPYSTRREVDVTPGQRRDLAPPQAGEGGEQGHGPNALVLAAEDLGNGERMSPA